MQPQLRTCLQHLLHPVNMWSRFGGRWVRLFRAYETYCWHPVLRQWLTKPSLTSSRCRRLRPSMDRATAKRALRRVCGAWGSEQPVRQSSRRRKPRSILRRSSRIPTYHRSWLAEPLGSTISASAVQKAPKSLQLPEK